MSTKEIVTLQLGNYANFVGTHWWNIQESSFKYKEDDIEDEEVDHDILFREGQTNRGEVTFTPRLVLTELKGGLGSLGQNSILYDDVESVANVQDSVCWDGVTIVHKETPEKRNKFLSGLENGTEDGATIVSEGKTQTAKTVMDYDLNNDVKVWSDYLRPHLHPKSMVIINEYNHMSENDPFDLWTKGANLSHVCEELEERVRFYAEECDFMQGFHILSDMHTGFAGLTSSVVRYLRDEFSSKELAVFPSYPACFPSDSKVKQLKRQLTQSLCLSGLAEHASLLCPTSLWNANPEQRDKMPYLEYDSSSNYHTSAILAAALDTATMKYRLRNNAGVHLQTFCSSTTSMGRNLASMSLNLPVPLAHGPAAPYSQTFNSLSSFLGHYSDIDPWQSLTQNSLGSIDGRPNTIECYAQCATLRGIPPKFLGDIRYADNPSVQCTAAEALKRYLDTRYYGSHNTAYGVKVAMPTAVPFPQFFSDDVGRDGFLKPRKLVPNPMSSVWTFRGLPALRMGHAASGETLNGGEPVTSATAQKSASQSHRATVESIPILTNVQCSSQSAGLLKAAAGCLHQGRKRHFSLHLVENDNLEDEIEHLQTLHDEYSSTNMDLSDSDGDL